MPLKDFSVHASVFYEGLELGNNPRFKYIKCQVKVLPNLGILGLITNHMIVEAIQAILIV